MHRPSVIPPAALLALLPLAPAAAQDEPPAGIQVESVVIVGDNEGGTVEWRSSSSGDPVEGLDLSEAQRGKIDGIRTEADKAVRARLAEAREKGDWAAMAPAIAKIRTDATERVKAELTPAQREQYEKQAATRDPLQALGGAAPFLKRLGRDGAFRPSAASRVDRAMKDLRIADAAEAEAVKALVSRVVALQDELVASDRSSREKTDGLLRNDGLQDDALAQRLEAFRADRSRLEESLRGAQAELLQVVSVRQEGVLFRHGILR